MILNVICIVAYFVGVFWYLHKLDNIIKFHPLATKTNETNPKYVTSCTIILSLLWPLSVIMDAVIYIIAIIVLLTRRKP